MVTGYTTARESAKANNETYLVMAAKQGNLDAFNQLVLRCQDSIFNLAARILGDDEAAEDITQNTFLTAYLNLSKFRNGSFRGWLSRIATNACYDEYRKYKRHPVLSIEDKELAEERIAPLFDFSSPNILPEAEFERHEVERAVQRALARLDIDHRSVVVLVDQQEFDYAEAAQILAVPVGTVKSRLSRARVQLRNLLSDPDGAFSIS